MERLYSIFITISVLVMSFLVFVSPANAIPQYPTEDAPDENIPVKITMHLSSLIAIDSINEFFEFAGYFQYSWKDERLDDGVVKLDDIWHPSVECVNFIEYQTISSIAKVNNGVVTVQERFKLKNSTEFDFTKFPFDDQHLDVAVESLNDAGVYFIPGPFTYGSDTFVNIGAWKILSSGRETLTNYFPPEMTKYARLNYSLYVRRKPEYYIVKIIAPVIALTFGTIISLFIPIKEFSTAMGAVLTFILTGLTLWLLSSDALPRTHQVSKIDKIMGVSILFQAVVFFLLLLFFQRGSRKTIVSDWFRNFLRIGLLCFYPVAVKLAILL